MENLMSLSPRQHWIGVLARARLCELQPHADALRDATAIWRGATRSTPNWQPWPMRICRARNRVFGSAN